MCNTKFIKPEPPFTVSSAFFIIITVLKIINLYILPTQRFGEFGYSLPVYTAVYMALTFLLAVFLIIKKLFVVNTVIIGLMAATDIYALLCNRGFFQNYTVYEILLEVLPYIIPITVWVLLFVISIGAATKRTFKNVGKIWFLPMILTFAITPLHILQYSINLIDTFLHGSYTNWGYNVTHDSLVFITYILEVVAIALLSKWYGRVIGAQREALKTQII